MIGQLKLLKEYIDAKADFDRARLAYESGVLVPSMALSDRGRSIRDRYLAAEKALNEAIKLERLASDTIPPP